MFSRNVAWGLGAACSLPFLSGCVTEDQRFGLVCPIVGGDVFVNSRLCDGDMRICDDKPYPHQNILILNRTPSSAVAVTLQFSDGSTENHVIPYSGELQFEKPIGTGVKVQAQC